MATHAPITGAPTCAPFIPAPPAAITRVLATFDRDQLAGFIAVAIDLLDLAGNDLDAEPATWPEAAGLRSHDNLPEDSEAVGDEHDIAYAEWDTRGRHMLPGGEHEPMDRAGHEDDEDADPDTSVEDGPEGFDPEEDMCLAGDDRVCSGPASRVMLLYEDEGPGDADDAEREQMVDDVPRLPIYALEPNPFNGERSLLGYTLPHYREGKLRPEL